MKDRIRRFVEAGEGDFDTLARALHEWQVARNPAYAAMAEDARPARVEDIPAVPVALFRSLPLASFPLEEPHVVFRTSGTTDSVRGLHRMRDTALYDAGAWTHFAASAGALPARVVSLCPTDPDSSLGHMVAHFAARLAAAGASAHGGAARRAGGVAGGRPPPPHEPVALFQDGALVADAWARIASAAAEGPILLAATAFALDALLALPGSVALDAASLVMVTGGFKGRKVRLDAPGLYAALPARLGAPRVIGEYGMTELSSQLWTAPVPAGQVPGAFVAPPWLRVYAVDPATGAPNDGVGLLRFVDLCNVDGVLAIETMDLGSVEGRSVTLHGRLEGAEARGCSLRAEEFLLAARGASDGEA